MFLLPPHPTSECPPGDRKGAPFLFVVFSFLSVCIRFFLLVVFSLFLLRCVYSKTSVPRGFLEEYAYFLLLDLVDVCLLLPFPSFGVVVCLPIVLCSAKYFYFFRLGVSCSFPSLVGASMFFVVVVVGVCFFFSFFLCFFKWVSGRRGGG